MKLYVIEKGQYSDRHIIGVAETEEEAKKICSVISTHPEEDWIEYTEYDTHQFATGRLRYHVYDWGDEWEAEYDDYDLFAMYKDNSEEYGGSYVIYANSPQQAIKIAQDMKAEKLAREKGVSL